MSSSPTRTIKSAARSVPPPYGLRPPGGGTLRALRALNLRFSVNYISNLDTGY